MLNNLQTSINYEILRTRKLANAEKWLYIQICICSAQKRHRYNSGIVLRKVGFLTMMRKLRIGQSDNNK